MYMYSVHCTLYTVHCTVWFTVFCVRVCSAQCLGVSCWPSVGAVTLQRQSFLLHAGESNASLQCTLQIPLHPCTHTASHCKLHTVNNPAHHVLNAVTFTKGCPLHSEPVHCHLLYPPKLRKGPKKEHFLILLRFTQIISPYLSMLTQD